MPDTVPAALKNGATLKGAPTLRQLLTQLVSAACTWVDSRCRFARLMSTSPPLPNLLDHLHLRLHLLHQHPLLLLRLLQFLRRLQFLLRMCSPPPPSSSSCSCWCSRSRSRSRSRSASCWGAAPMLPLKAQRVSASSTVEATVRKINIPPAFRSIGRDHDWVPHPSRQETKHGTTHSLSSRGTASYADN